MLVLDDEEDVCAAMVALLHTCGVQATAVSDESHAVTAWDAARAAGQPFDALLCDWRLAHGADGLAAAQRLRAHAGGRWPVLMITGETDPVKLRRLRDSALPVLFKPVFADALLQALADLVAPRSH